MQFSLCIAGVLNLDCTLESRSRGGRLKNIDAWLLLLCTLMVLSGLGCLLAQEFFKLLW